MQWEWLCGIVSTTINVWYMGGIHCVQLPKTGFNKWVWKIYQKKATSLSTMSLWKTDQHVMLHKVKLLLLVSEYCLKREKFSFKSCYKKVPQAFVAACFSWFCFKKYPLMLKHSSQQICFTFNRKFGSGPWTCAGAAFGGRSLLWKVLQCPLCSKHREANGISTR